MVSIDRFKNMQYGELEFWKATKQDKNRDSYSDHWLQRAEKIYQVHKEDEVVVDIGTGPIPISPTVRDVISIDPLASSYRAIGYNKRFNALTAVGEYLPIKSESVDCIYCVNTIDHCQDPSLFIKECYRILKPNGVFRFQMDVRTFEDSLHNKISKSDMLNMLSVFRGIKVAEDIVFSATRECTGIIGECLK